jgi:hypothetical protein
MRMRRLGGILILLALLLGGCSSTTFLYNRLDFIIPWYIGGYVDLERDDKKELKRLLEGFLYWHRSEELPRYGAMLDDMLASLDRPATAAGVADTTAAIEAAWFRLEARAVDWMIELGEGLRDEQLDQFIARLRKDQAEWEEEYLSRSDEEYVEDAYERFLDTAQDYMGRLDWGQRGILETAAGNMRRSDTVWLAERALWIERLEDILQREPGWQQRLLDDLDGRDESVSPEYGETVDHNLRVIHQAIADLINSRSEKQDVRLRREIAKLRQDVDTLVAQLD